MKTLRDEGIIFHSLNFGDYDKIITIFTIESGLIKLFVRGANRARTSLHSLTSPLTKAEFVFSSRKGELHRFHEGKAIDFYQSLRRNLELMNIACSMTRAVHASQMLGKPAPKLYKLFSLYFDRLSIARAPENLLSSFYLKILRHEGIFSLRNKCSFCQTSSNTIFFFYGESFCQKHSDKQAIKLNEQEIASIQKLAFSRNFSEMESIEINKELEEKIHTLFKKQLSK